MARGGYRPGAGRPKGAMGVKKSKSGASKKSKDKPKGKSPKDNPDLADAIADEGTPLAYMLQVMKDGTADEARRDRMAIAAAPFVHGRAGEVTGKKGEKAKAAQNASKGRFAPAAAPKLVVNNR